MSASSGANCKIWADKQLGVDAGPYGLVKKCAEMLGYVLKSKARAAHMLPRRNTAAATSSSTDSLEVDGFTRLG
jgi:hypothetical protein